MNLPELKQAMSGLSLERLRKLEAWLRSRIELAERTRSRRAGGKRPAIHKTYRLELVRCGKKSCKCAASHLHGPYWYAYWSEGGVTKSQYIGKRLPKGLKTSR